MNWQDENVVVTGGNGFIGSHLVNQLQDKDCGLYVVDDLSRGRRKNLSAGSAMFYRHTLGAKFDPSFDTLFSDKIVFHLAAKVAGIHYNMTHHLDMMESNLLTNMAVSSYCTGRSGVLKPKLLVWVSTACVYPHDAPVPTPESCADTCDPEPTNFGYGVAKWVGEQQAKYLCKEYGIPTIIVRFFNAFGPRDYYDKATSHVAPALIRRVMEGENPLVVWGSGEQTRALVDARDIAQALVMLAERGMLVDRAHTLRSMPWIVNIGHEEEISIAHLASLICEIAAKHYAISIPRLEFDTSKPDGYPRRAADTTCLKSLIGWVPDTPIETTLCDMFEDYLYQKEQGWIDD